MAIKVCFILYVTIVAMVILAAYQSNGASMNHRSRIPFNKRTGKHPCDNVENNTLLHTLNGDIVCRLPSNDRMRQKLDLVGGYNRHYVSTTLKEAQLNFKNLFESYGEDYSNTSEWQAWHLKDVENVQQSLDQAGGSLQIQKREENSSNIQCLDGGRVTAQGIHFCPACQRCTEMEPNIYPRYVNELTCDNSASGSSSSPGCFLGNVFRIGTCSQTTMTIDLLIHKDGKYKLTYENATTQIYEAVYVTYTKELRISCECMGFPSKVYTFFQKTLWVGDLNLESETEKSS